MKNILMLSITLLISLTVVGIVDNGIISTPAIAAEEVNSTSNETLVEAGILPDSNWFRLKLWWEEVQEFFTFGDENKAELSAKLAMQRLAEAKKLMDKGKTELAVRHLEKYQERFEKALTKTEGARQQGKDVDAIVERLTENNLRQQAVLAEVYEKVPENAKAGVLNAMESSAKGLTNAIEKVQQSEEVKEFKDQLKNKIENIGAAKALEIKERFRQQGIIEEEADESNTEDDTTGNGNNTNSAVQQQTETNTQNQGTNSQIQVNTQTQTQNQNNQSD
ncbi:MAG: DUF5667 domain-containing protein [Patescibacteria group bacterium]